MARKNKTASSTKPDRFQFAPNENSALAAHLSKHLGIKFLPSRFELPELPRGGVIIPAGGMLKSVRERLGLSQAGLGLECGVSRDVIANYESGRTKLDRQSLISVEELLKIWKVLETKERALGRNVQGEAGQSSAADAVLGLLWLAKLSARGSLAEIDGQITGLKQQQEGVKRHIEEIDSEIGERSK